MTRQMLANFSGGGAAVSVLAREAGAAVDVVDVGVGCPTGNIALGPGWAWDDEPYYYNAQTSGLTMAPNTDFDAGSIIVRVNWFRSDPSMALDKAMRTPIKAIRRTATMRTTLPTCRILGI